VKRLSTFRLTFILILLPLVALSILFGVMAYQDYRDEESLADEVEAVELQIARLAQLHDIDTLEAELASLVAQLNDMPFPQYVKDNVIFGLVQQSAVTAGVTIESWVIEGVTSEAIDGSALGYPVYYYEVTASGTLPDIFTFLSEMEENAPYETIRLDEVELTYDTDSDSWSITFEILAFAQP